MSKSFSHSSLGRDLPPHPRRDPSRMGLGSANPPVGFGRTGQGSSRVSNLMDLGSTSKMGPQRSHNMMSSSSSSQSIPSIFRLGSRGPAPLSSQPARDSDQANRILASFGLSSSDLDELSRFPEDKITAENLPEIIQHLKRKRSEHMEMLNYRERLSRDSLRPSSDNWDELRPLRRTSFDDRPSGLNPVVDYGHGGSSRERSYRERLDVGDTLRDRERIRDDRFLSEPPFRKSESDYNRLGYSSLQERPVFEKSRGMPSGRNIDDFHGLAPKDFPHVCSLCELPQNSFQSWEEHISGRLHKRQCLLLLDLYPEWNGHRVGADPYMLHQSTNPAPGILGPPPPPMPMGGPNSRHGNFRGHPGNEDMPGTRQMPNRQAKTPKDTKESKPKEKTCGLCSCSLPETWSKLFCQLCINKNMAGETVATMKGFMEAMQKRTHSTLEAVEAISENQTTTSNMGIPSRSFPNQGIDSDEHSVASKDNLITPFTDAAEAARATKFRFSTEEAPALLKAIFSTMHMNVESDPLSVPDTMYDGLKEGIDKGFPMHESLKDIISREWKEPERQLFVPKALKSSFPLEEDNAPWAKCPRLDLPLAQVSTNTDLSFEDLCTLKDPMDKKADVLLERAWEAASFMFKPAISTDCVSRNLAVWLNNLKDRLVNDTPKEEILGSLAILNSAVNYISDALVETIRVNAKVAALVNSARRAIWLKTWSGTVASKRRLCGIPFEGQWMFGSELETVLNSPLEKGKKFPISRNTRGRGGFRGRYAGWGPGDRQSKQTPYKKGGNPPKNSGKGRNIF